MNNQIDLFKDLSRISYEVAIRVTLEYQNFLSWWHVSAINRYKSSSLIMGGKMVAYVQGLRYKYFNAKGYHSYLSMVLLTPRPPILKTLVDTICLTNEGDNMKTHQNQKIKSQSYKSLLLAFALFLTACDQEIGIDKMQKGISHAKHLKPEIHTKYLACYALDSAAKQSCYNMLNYKYIDAHRRNDEVYVDSLQI